MRTRTLQPFVLPNPIARSLLPLWWRWVVVIVLDKELHIAVPETDYAKIATLNDCVSYLQQRSK